MLELTLDKEGEKALREALMEQARLLTAEIRAKAKENLQANMWPVLTYSGHTMMTSIIDTGELMSSQRTTRLPDGYLLEYTAPHAWTVEKGMKAGVWVPIKPLKAWAKRKLGDEGAAYGVQRKIHEKGITPRPFLSEAVWGVLAGL